MIIGKEYSQKIQGMRVSKNISSRANKIMLFGSCGIIAGSLER